MQTDEEWDDDDTPFLILFPGLTPKDAINVDRGVFTNDTGDSAQTSTEQAIELDEKDEESLDGKSTNARLHDT